MSIRQLFLAVSLTIALPAGAQGKVAPTPTPTPPTVLSLAQALQAARSNLDVSLVRRSLAAAQADVLAADHAPAPALSAKASSIDLQNGIGSGNLITKKRVDKGIGLDWTWERGNKRALRTLAAQRSAAAAEADVDDTLVQQQLATSSAFFDLLAAQERIEQVGAIARSAEQLAATAARRVKAGDLAAQDAARTEIEAQRAQSDLLTAQLDRQRAALALGQLTGLASSDTLVAQPDWPARNADAAIIDVSTFQSVEGRAEVRAALQRVEAAQAALDVASAQKKADITLGSSFDHFPGVSNRLVELRMQIPLHGIFGGYNFQGEIARALAQLELAQDTLEKTRRTASFDLQRLQQDKQGAAARALSYESTILPRARKLADMAELAYSKGAMSLTELIDARRTLRTILLDALAARTEYAKAAQMWQLRLQQNQPAPAL